MWPESLDPTKTLLLVQFLVQAVLLGIVVFFMLVDKKRNIPTSVFDELKSVIQQTQQLSDSFRDQIQAKVDLVNGVIAELDGKIREAELLMEGLEKTSIHTKQARSYTQSDVVRLYKGGFDPVDISQITGIPIGEIQLMVKINPQDNH